MTDEQQPRAEWIFPEQKKSNKGRIWLIIGLVVATLVIFTLLLFFLVPHDGAPSSTPSPTVTRSATPSAQSTPTETPSPEPTSSDPTTPIDTPPPIVDPDLATFAALVQPRVDDAATGLSIAAGASGQDAVAVVDQLQQDAERLSGFVAPSSIADAWYADVSQYAARLGELRSAFESGSGTDAAITAATTALQQLRQYVGA